MQAESGAIRVAESGPGRLGLLRELPWSAVVAVLCVVVGLLFHPPGDAPYSFHLGLLLAGFGAAAIAVSAFLRARAEPR